MIGRDLAGYRIIEQIGLGGMATVYKAYEPSTDRYVALKLLHESYASNPEFLERFKREARAIARLEHPYILPIFAYGEENGIAYLAMRYLAGGSLSALLKGPLLTLSEVVRLVGQIASALDHAHQHHILHRDVKPSNVLIDSSGNAILTDFGIAKMLDITLDLTGGGIVGTPAYMSPEQCNGVKNLTPATDQYSLGIILYQMVTHHVPFEAETPLAVMLMHMNDPLPLPRTVRPDLPEQFELAILRALSKNPADRFPTCSALAEACGSAANGYHLRPEDIATVDARTMAMDSAPTPVAAIATAPALASDQATVPTVPARRSLKLPRFALIAIVLLMVASVGVGLVYGLTRHPVQVAASALSADSLPDQPVMFEGKLKSGELPVFPPGDPPAAGLKAVPCDRTNLGGAGLCIYDLSTPWEVKRVQLPAYNQFSAPASWSPDGKKILVGLEHGSGGRVYVVDYATLTVTELAPGRDMRSAVWSPDNKWIVADSEARLVRMKPDGTDLRAIWSPRQDINEAVGRAQWSPDGQWILFAIIESPGLFPQSSTQAVIRPDGSDLHRLVSVRFADHPGCPFEEGVFSPDGKNFAFYGQGCQVWYVPLTFADDPVPLAEFPGWWMSDLTTQWGSD